jgi:acyl carrier protein
MDINKLNECLSFNKKLELNEDFESHPEWDSMAKLILITCLEENFEIKISDSELSKFKNIKEILNDFKK